MPHKFVVTQAPSNLIHWCMHAGYWHQHHSQQGLQLCSTLATTRCGVDPCDPPVHQVPPGLLIGVSLFKHPYYAWPCQLSCLTLLQLYHTHGPASPSVLATSWLSHHSVMLVPVYYPIPVSIFSLKHEVPSHKRVPQSMCYVAFNAA